VRVVALVPDLLFGSKVQGMLAAAGHEVELVPTAERAREAEGDVVVVDLTAEFVDPAGLSGPTLAFYSHVDVDTKARAEAAGYDLVVPRSRMAREGAALVEKVAEGPPASGAPGAEAGP
jgi:ABC-type sugar transport system substrate-binding protein